MVIKFQVVRRERKYHGCGEEYTVEKKRKGKQYHHKIEDVGKNINCGSRGKEGIVEGNQYLRRSGGTVGEEYQVVRNLIHP